MGATTTRRSLYLFGGGSDGQYGADEVMDVSKINASLVKIDGDLYPAVASLNALVALLPSVPEGAIVSVAPTTLTGSIKLYQSNWQKSGGIWRPTAIFEISGDTTMADLLSAGSSLFTFQQANSSAIAWKVGQRMRGDGGLGMGNEIVWYPGNTWGVVALPDMRIMTMFNGGQYNIGANSWTTIPTGDNQSDPRGMNAGNGSQINLLWKGRYRAILRSAVQSDISSTGSYGLRVCKLPGVSLVDEQMWWGTLANHGNSMITEFYGDPADSNNNVVFFQTWSSIANGLSYGTEATKSKMMVQYLGAQ